MHEPVTLLPPDSRDPTAGAVSSGFPDDLLHQSAERLRVLARLRSPHTVELFDFGIATDGAFYYVMELHEGLDADALLRRSGPVPPERAIPASPSLPLPVGDPADRPQSARELSAPTGGGGVRARLEPGSCAGVGETYQ